MMQCQSADSDSSENVSESWSTETLDVNSAEESSVSVGWQQSSVQKEPAILPYSPTQQQLSQADCQMEKQLLTQSQNDASSEIILSDSQMSSPECCAVENQQFVINNSSQLFQVRKDDLLVKSDSDKLKCELDTGKIPPKTGHFCHPCQQPITDSSPSIMNSTSSCDNSVSHMQTLASGTEIDFKTQNFLQSNIELQNCSTRLEKDNGCNTKPLTEYYDNIGQQQDQSNDENFLQGGQDEDHANDHVSDQHCLPQQQQNGGKITLTNDNQFLRFNDSFHLQQSNENSGSIGKFDSLADTSEGCESKQCEIVDGIFPSADKIPSDRLTSAYNVLFERYVSLRQQCDEQLNVQKKMEDDYAAVNARIASVIVERDRYLTKLNEFEELSLVDSEEVKQLELVVEQQKQQILVLKEKLSNQEISSKQAAASVEVDVRAQIEQLRRKYEDCERDKQSMVVKYAQAEQKNIELQEKMTKMDGWLKDWSRQRDNIMGRLNATAAEKQKLTQLLENRASELVSVKREIERQKELVTSQEMKAKWHQNKLKVELEAHKETKSKLEEMNQKLRESKEECEKVKQESQSIIKTYQMSQVMDSITKELQLKETEEELMTQRLEQTEQKEVLQMVKQELEGLKSKEKELVEELNTYKDKVTCLEAERVLQEETLAKFKDTLQSQKKVNRDLTEQVAELEFLRPEINELKQQLIDAQKEAEELKQSNKDLLSDMDSYVNQESEYLKFSQRLSDETVRLQSENLALGDEIASLSSERESLKSSVSCLSTKCETLEVELKNLMQIKQHAIEELEKKLNEQTDLVDKHAKQLEEREDELKTLKRRHLSSSKDLRRQLSQLQKHLEQCESKTTNSTSSTLSRDNNSNIATISDIDKEVLIDKIIKLQKSHARKNEKIEFMQDHVNQLLEEVRKKSRIIQNYIMREESYSLVPADVVKQGKVVTTKKGGMFVSSETGRDVYDDLVEHNSRLQTVLEDKVIHNLTLKHTVETLGQEISHLSCENRKLQQDLQQLQNQLSQPSGD